VWCFLGGRAEDGKRTLIALPVAHRMTRNKILLALYVEVHSRLVNWFYERVEERAAGSRNMGASG